MKLKVTGKQPNSKYCFVCGLENEFGLKSKFYEMENGELIARFFPAEVHQSYPGRLHGGVSAAILDEAIGRLTINHKGSGLWGVTLEFSMKFRKPVPLDKEVLVRAKITSENKRTFEGIAEIILADGTVAVEGKGRYLKMSLTTITEDDFEGEQWQVVDEEDDPAELELPRNNC
ncbi:MAG: PaaI family thioesterase [Desulfofustis sp.]|nr:PaaI family thioesterase [Desulfofustis sp.]